LSLQIITGMKRVSHIFVLTAVIFISQHIAAESNSDAWQLLMENDVAGAEKIFTANIEEKNDTIRGEAYRGLEAIARFVGDHQSEAYYVTKAYECDNDVIYFNANIGSLLGWSRLNAPKNSAYIEKIVTSASKEHPLFSGHMLDMLLQRYSNDGKISQAEAISEKLGTIKKWKMIGPFDNISNCGYENVYEPEQELDFTKTYTGKDGNTVRWVNLENKSPGSWIFLENHTTSSNAVYYFYTGVTVEKPCTAILSFGSSSTHKIFLNGTVVLRDSVFRNTGIDTYMRKIKLQPGNNRLLVKVGHEMPGMHSGLSGKANFALRILDTTYHPAENISFQTEKTESAYDSAEIISESVSPISDTISTYLRKKLEKNENNVDALIALLMHYNFSEMTNKAQLLVEEYVKRYPESALLYTLYSEALMRAKKFTEAEIAVKRAASLSALSYAGWDNSLDQIMEQGNPSAMIDFLDNSPERFRKKASAALGYFSAYAAMQNKAKVFEALTILQENYLNDPSALTMVYSVYVSQGKMKEAEEIIKNFLETSRLNVDQYTTLAGMYIKMGKVKKAIEILEEGVEHVPNNPNLYYHIANIYYTQKKYKQALQAINTCLETIPNSASTYNLKGNILASWGKKDEAEETFREAIAYTSDDFTAWESIRSLTNKPSFENMTPLPDVDSLIGVSDTFVQGAGSNAAIISYIEDLYYYPSHSSRSRTFLVVHLPTQKEIENWKEYRIEYNPSYQTYSVDKALTKKADGTEIRADVNQNAIIFKSLEPGDYIVLEYGNKNYYQGKMADKVYGKMGSFIRYPLFSATLRMVTPHQDTIPYTVVGDSIRVTKKNLDDVLVTTFIYPESQGSIDESYTPADFPTLPKVFYSTFSSWSEIAQWYVELTRNKQRPTLEIKTLADSLFKETSTVTQKVEAVHRYICGNINYSYVPFRQSGWVPQSAQDILATKIGDCKDMASLGKSLLTIGGVQSELVLVNTNQRFFTDHAYIGPNFNHCILHYMVDSDDHFVDFTYQQSDYNTLPLSDQGAMALIIRNGEDSLITLPVDKPEKRQKKRRVAMKLSADGTLKRRVQTSRTGIHAADFRGFYRYLSPKDRNKEMYQVLSRMYPELVLDTFFFQNLDTLSESLHYTYAYTAKNAIDKSGTTAIFALHLPDAIDVSDFPLEDGRRLPVDLHYSRFSTSMLQSEIVLTYPPGWKLMSVPDAKSFSTPHIKYQLRFKTRDNKLLIKRRLKARYDRVFSPQEFDKERAVLKKIAKADDVSIVFMTE